VVWQGAAAKPEGKRERKAPAEQKNKVAVVVLGVAGVAFNTVYCMLLLCFSSVEKQAAARSSSSAPTLLLLMLA